MKELIKRILKEQEEEPVLSKKEILLFKFINDNKQKSGTKPTQIRMAFQSIDFGSSISIFFTHWRSQGSARQSGSSKKRCKVMLLPRK